MRIISLLRRYLNFYVIWLSFKKIILDYYVLVEKEYWKIVFELFFIICLE